MTSITTDELAAVWESVGLSRQQVLNEVSKPKGSFNSYDYATKWGVSLTKAKLDLIRLTAAGKLKKTLVKVRTSWVPYYTTVQSESCPVSQNGKKTAKSQK